MPPPRTVISTWRVAAAALAAALALGASGCVAPTGVATPAPADSQRQLAELTVASSGSMRGYSRDRFPHWRSIGDNCDVRDAVLRRDGDGVRERGCNVVAGHWVSPYDNRTFTDPDGVDIDHMVPLANAWRSGASEWTDARREDFANDTTRPQLIAVSAASNRAKGDQDPSQWKPPNREFWCVYAQDWISVKHYWRLSITVAEKTALTKMLETCPWPSDTPSSSAPRTSLPDPVGY